MSRIEKVAQALKKEVSQIIHDELKDPRLGFITVTRVSISADLRLAKVYYSVLGEQKESDNAKKGLNSAKGYIRRLVGRSLGLRFTPEIMFILDKSIEYSIRISEELERIKKEGHGHQEGS